MLRCHWKKETQRTCADCCLILFLSSLLVDLQRKIGSLSCIPWWIGSITIPQQIPEPKTLQFLKPPIRVSRHASRCIAYNICIFQILITPGKPGIQKTSWGDLTQNHQKSFPCVVNLKVQAKAKLRGRLLHTATTWHFIWVVSIVSLRSRHTTYVFIGLPNSKDQPNPKLFSPNPKEPKKTTETTNI